jgi:exosome complex component RRP41
MKRTDGRKPDELRPLRIEVGVVPNANGSALFTLGKTTAIAAVYGPRPLHPRHMQVSNRAYLRTVYSLVPFSTTERNRPGPSRRSKEICKVTMNALEPAVFLEEFPKATIDVFIDILQADAGTRTAGINAASMALADAGIPMRDLVTSVAGGMIDGECVIDLGGEEEDLSACDMPVAYMPGKKMITLLQLDGKIPPGDAAKILKLALKKCEFLYEKQKEALRKKWVKK